MAASHSLPSAIWRTLFLCNKVTKENGSFSTSCKKNDFPNKPVYIDTLQNIADQHKRSTTTSILFVWCVFDLELGHIKFVCKKRLLRCILSVFPNSLPSRAKKRRKLALLLRAGLIHHTGNHVSYECNYSVMMSFNIFWLLLCWCHWILPRSMVVFASRDGKHGGPPLRSRRESGSSPCSVDISNAISVWQVHSLP